MGMFDVLDALSYPQRKLKEAVSGDEDRWFPEGAATGAGGTYKQTSPLPQGGSEFPMGIVADVLADPLNVLPIGMMGKAARAIPLEKLKGLAISSAPNYIKNFYGLTDGPVRANAAESVIMKMIPDKLRGQDMLEEDKLGLLRKLTGTAKWAGEAAKNAAISVLTPSGRALYADTGINKGLQNTVGRHLASAEKKGQAKAGANINYNLHQTVQAGRKGDLAESMTDVGRMSNLETYTPNEVGTIAGWMEKHSGTVKGPRKNAVAKPDPVSPSDAQYMENHATGAWGATDDVVMKRSTSGTGGDHYQDLFFKSPFVSAVSRAFAENNWKPTLKKLYTTMKKLEKAQPLKKKNKFFVKNKNFADVEKNGLWLTGALPGTAITEGGVNWLGKVEPSGKLMGMISDKHDFLDKMAGQVAGVINKLPGVNVGSDITKRSLLAVTPPMKGTIQNIRRRQYVAAGNTKGVPTYSGIPTPKRTPKQPLQREVLEQYTKVKPSAKALKAEQLRQAGAFAAAGALYQGGNSSGE